MCFRGSAARPPVRVADFCVHWKHPQGLFHHRLLGPPPEFLLQWEKWGWRICISNKLTDAAATGLGTTSKWQAKVGGRKALWSSRNQEPLRPELGGGSATHRDVEVTVLMHQQW